MKPHNPKTRRDFLRDTALLAAGGVLAGIPVAVSAQTPAASMASVPPPDDGELLYNGIRLPKQWPPLMDNSKTGPRKPMRVPYLEHPPQVIPIDVGRQLFVDDFLIEHTDLTRTYHHAERYAGNPILKPETKLEIGEQLSSNGNRGPSATLFQDGVWFDPKDQLFKLWYHAGVLNKFSKTAYVTSKDGLTWDMRDSFSQNLTMIGLLCGYGTRVLGVERSAPRAASTAQLTLNPDGGGQIKIVDGTIVAADSGDQSQADRYEKLLRKKGILDSSNRTDILRKKFESDTHELFLDGSTSRFYVNTPRSVGLSLPKGPVQDVVGNLEVENKGPDMTLLLSSLSAEPLSKSKRLLLILSGDALNNEMKFTDDTRKELVNIGKTPVLVRILKVNLKVRLASARNYSLWVLAQNGTRLEKIPCRVKDGVVNASIDTGTFRNGPSNYFEFALD